MTSYFWSGFPSLSGRSDVMYGRRHIGGATSIHPLRHPYRLGLLHAIVPPISSSWFCRFGSLAKRRLKSPVAINEPILPPSSARYPRKRLRKEETRLSRRRARFVSRARTKSKLVFDLMAMRNYASQPYVAYACTANWPGRSARGPSGTFQLLEGITTSVHHLLYLFSAHDHHDHRAAQD